MEQDPTATLEQQSTAAAIHGGCGRFGGGQPGDGPPRAPALGGVSH
ncbi:MAG: hypothetical protein R3E12_04890 [Candidatus Eisenbacteria bacterium]|uniref:Uncharacterized protein n=1 Tax=Eiseniibacteriota bacterium TaxID=2212470 RepID=A0A956LXF3_UNCEI|nr:hypothetical protein [Candidatus Eisenbacteria bacterium]